VSQYYTSARNGLNDSGLSVVMLSSTCSSVVVGSYTVLNSRMSLEFDASCIQEASNSVHMSRHTKYKYLCLTHLEAWRGVSFRCIGHC
jgi:hypothetical protein